MVKYINDWLPVGALVSKYAKHYPPGCPSCDGEFETRKHMLQCPTQRIQKQKLITNLKQFMNYFPTDPMLKFTLLRAIKGVLSGEDWTVPTHERKYTMLIQQQQAIGWDQLLLGRFAKEWKEVANDHIRTLPKKERKKSVSGKTWVTGVAQIIFDFAWSV